MTDDRDSSGHSFDPSLVEPLAGHWIDGCLVADDRATIDVRRPSDSRVHGSLPLADDATVDRAVRAAAGAQPRWAALAPRARAALLMQWADALSRDSVTLAQEESLVSARIYHETLAVDVPASANWIRFYAECADKIDGAVTPTDGQALSLVVHEPYGVVGAISPWNFPLVLALWKAAPAMAAGNCVVIKPSELTPYSITRAAQLATAAGIPDGVLNVVHGVGSEAGTSLVRHPDVNYLAFTGSTATGASIMSDAALSGVKPVSLELGGKSPQLVFEDCGDLDRVADNIAWGISRNAGQLCYAGTRLVVARSIEADLLDRIAARLAKLEPGPTWEAGTTLAPIISERQAERIQSLVASTISEGADCVLGGRPMSLEGGGHYFAPTILRGLTTAMTGFRQEIFGPVLGVQVFDSESEGIALAQHPLYGLAGSVYTRDLERAVRAARRLKSGTVWINTWGRKSDMTSPFGGFGQSGFGKEAGKAGYEKFLRTKSVWIDLPEGQG